MVEAREVVVARGAEEVETRMEKVCGLRRYGTYLAMVGLWSLDFRFLGQSTGLAPFPCFYSSLSCRERQKEREGDWVKVKRMLPAFPLCWTDTRGIESEREGKIDSIVLKLDMWCACQTRKDRIRTEERIEMWVREDL